LTKKALRLFTDRSNLKVGHFGPAGVGHFRPASYGHFNPARVVYYVRRFQTTKYEDLAIVCSNCHRMLHRKTFEGNYPTVDELRSIIYKKMN
ncbi:hypothetical protein, partial [Muricauda sp. TY007]|uniref:hypothetical protein n=1 Tax=Allomuricauda sp. TY007 TaxID=2683200 RepID=UPI00193EE926